MLALKLLKFISSNEQFLYTFSDTMAFFLTVILVVDTRKHKRNLSVNLEKEDKSFSDDSLIINVEDDVPPDKTISVNRHSTHTKNADLKKDSCTKPSSSSHTSVDIKPEPFDSGYGVHDAMLNGYSDLFHEVDSLMNIKHEDHLNDTVFYLPMSCPGEINPNVELENAIQMSEAFRNDFPGSVFCNQDIKSDPSIVDALPFSETDFLNDHSKDSMSNPSDSSTDNSSSHCSKKQRSASANRGKCAESRLEESQKCIVSTEYLGLVEDVLPAGRKSRIKSGKSDSQSDDSGIGEPHSVSSSVCNTSSSFSESDGAVSPVDVCSLDSSATNSPEAEKTYEEASNENQEESEGDDEGKEKEEEKETFDPDRVEVKLEVEEEEGEDQPYGTSNSIGSCCSTTSCSSQEPSDIDRFVICSDHTMECVLCSYTTDSYSAFKSHIICSHPCWRITKKLSKNRLLVERSIKNGVRIPSKKIGEKALPGDLDSTLTGGRKLNKKYIYRRQLFERNKRLFKCVLCLRLFVFEGSVVNHVTETHQEKVAYDFIHVSNDHGEHFGPIYRCSQKTCFFSADNEADLTKHHAERHMQVIYRCQLCGFTAGTADSVRAHGLRMHKQQLACFISTGPLAITQGTVVKSN